MSNGCPMGMGRNGDCEISDTGMPIGCCDVNIDISIGLADVAMTDTHHYKQLLTLDAPQPPSALILATDLTIASSDVSDKLTVTALSVRPDCDSDHTHCDLVIVHPNVPTTPPCLQYGKVETSSHV